MYLDAITLVKTLPCLAEPGKIIVIGKPSQPLTAVIPYMAALPSVIVYNPTICAVTFRRQPGFMTLEADRVCITQVKDAAEGLELLKALVDAVNATWEHRAELVAVTAARRAPHLLDIWSLLPQTNCGQCGEAACMAFAAALLQQKRVLTECPSLTTDPVFGERRATLERIL